MNPGDEWEISAPPGHRQESDDEYDVHEAAWQNGVIKRQFAETTVVKARIPLRLPSLQSGDEMRGSASKDLEKHGWMVNGWNPRCFSFTIGSRG